MNAGKDSWWNKFGRPKGQPETKDERERALVRVLSGEEELAELDVPKVGRCCKMRVPEIR